MKLFYSLVVAAIVAALTTSEAKAQLNFPRGSQQASVTQTVGITKIQIDYSRPSVNNREIWGNLVPYGMNNLGFGTAKESPWRAGADENTTIQFNTDVYIEGKALKAGLYGFHIVVMENDKATLIFSNNNTAWGSFFYKPEEDALRVDIATKTIPHVEQLTYLFEDVTSTSATVVLNWEKKQFPFKISVDVNKTVVDGIKQKLQNQEGFSRQTWEQAAGFVLANGGDYNEALNWINNAISGQFYSQKTGANLMTKAQLLNKLGKTSEAASVMDEASKIATINELNAMGYQMMGLNDNARAKQYFELAIEKDPSNANAYDSMGDYYRTVGDTKNAIKYFKKALSMNPLPNVRASSEKHLKELGAL